MGHITLALYKMALTVKGILWTIFNMNSREVAKKHIVIEKFWLLPILVTILGIENPFSIYQTLYIVTRKCVHVDHVRLRGDSHNKRPPSRDGINADRPWTKGYKSINNQNKIRLVRTNEQIR